MQILTQSAGEAPRAGGQAESHPTKMPTPWLLGPANTSGYRERTALL